MALFEKKICGICGDKLGLMGKKKATDGVICKDCAARLSRWVSEEQEFDLRQLRSQLVDRQVNRQIVADFTETRTYGEVEKIRFDATRRQFMIAASDNLTLENPDVIPYQAVLDCILDVEQEQIEDKQKDEKGKLVSFNPPRYHYLFNFVLTIKLDHPWIQTMTLRLNRDSVNIPGEGSGVSAQERDKSAEYRRFANMAEEIRNTLLFSEVMHRPGMEGPGGPGPAPAPAPADGPVCSSCGSPMTPGSSFCTECGAKQEAEDDRGSSRKHR